MAVVQGAILLRHLRKLVKAHQPGHESDRQLLARFLADGEEAAFAALVQRHGPMVLGVCKSVLQHQEDAEDAFQATFLVLARKAGGIRKQESVSSWLHGVAYRLALKAKSLAGKRRAKEKTVLEPACDNPVDDLSVREWQAILHDELHRLPEKYRAVLLLCYWEGKTRDEAAEQLGVAKGTLKEQLERARNLLRSRLTRRGLIPSAAIFTALFAQNAANAVLPISLVDATAKAALTFAAGKSTAGLSSVLLAEGALRAMQMTKWATTALLLILVGGFSIGLGFLATNQGGAQAEIAANEQANADGKKVAQKKYPLPDDADKPGREKDAPAQTPRVRWNGHKKDLPRSDLKIDLAPATKVQRMQGGLLLPVKITNQSKETIATSLPHEWHGGEWPTTDLYASAIVQRLVPPPDDHQFRPLFQFGEREGQATKPIMLQPGQSIDVNVRMDWPGTGSVIGIPLMKPAAQGKYEVRLLLVFEVGKIQQYVVGATTVVELPPPPQKAPPAKVKDADAGRWLTENLDRFEFALGNNGVVPSPNTLFFATKEKKLQAGSNAKVFVITKDEAASIVQTLVDSGLWGRPQEFPHLGPFGRFMTLAPANWTWSLGRADEDVSSRFIVQHLLKISTGEREQAIKDWLAQGIKQPPKKDAREASAAPFVRRLGQGNGPAFGQQAVFMTAEAFAKALPESAPPFKIPEVDYAKERLVAFSWWGGADSSMWFELMPEEKGKVIVFHREHGAAENKALKTFLFAVSNEAVFRVKGAPEPPAVDPSARPINFAGLEIEIPDKGFGPPTIIADQQQLAKAIPKSAEQIANKIDFGKESLYLFRWTGSGADALSFKVNSGVKGGKEQRIVAFQYQPGGPKTDDSHSYLFAIAKSAVVSVDGIPAPAGRDPLVNGIDLTGLQAPMPAKDFGRPIEIRSMETLTKTFTQKELHDRIKTQVDFTKETLHFFAWSGSGGDRLTWGIAYRFEASELQPVVVYHYQGGVQANDQAHFKLFAVANKARWRIARPHGETDKPYVRKVDFVNTSAPAPANAFGKPTVISNAAELANAFPGAEQAIIKQQVDFAKDQLLYFAWSSRAGATIAHEVDFKSRGEGIEYPVILFRLQPGKAALAVGHHHLYAIGRDASWVVAQAGPEPPPAVREIDMRDFKPKGPRGDVKKPWKISNATELAGVLLTYSDKAWNGKIAPQVDFKNEHLLFFSWGGSSGDKLTFKTVLKDGSPVVVFRYVQGEDTDLVPHVRVFVLPNDATWRLAVGDRPAGGPDKPAVREIQTNFIPPASTRGPQDAVRITSADELAKVFTDKPRYNVVIHQVDFDEEHLLFFNWSGGGGEKLDFRAIDTAKGTEVVFRHDATSKDTAKRHIRLIVMPFHATWRVEAVKFEGPQKLEVRPIPLGPITVDRIAPAGGAGARIKNRDEAAVYFTDQTNLDVVLKRVDFSKEYLVLFAWQATTDDRLVTTMEVANGQRIAVFQYKPGVEKAKRMRVELFGVPHEFTARGETLRVPIAEPINTRTREIDILGFQGPRPNDRAGKPLKIDNADALATVFKDKAWLDKVQAQVDFKSEYLVYHTWTGAKFDQLSYSLEPGEKGPIVVFHYAMGKNLAIGNYFRLFAVPNNATWRFEEVRGGKGK